MAAELNTTPFWVESTSDFPPFPRLDRDERAEVVVVGAGMTGLTSAYLLAAAGRSVVLLERRRAVEVDTAHTSAHLTMVTDVRLSDLVSSFGRDHAQAAWDAGLAGDRSDRGDLSEEGIACGFARVPGYLHLADGCEAADIARLQEEARLAVELGFDAEFTEQTPLMRVPGVMFANQARFHPRRYLAALAQAMVPQGGRIYEHTEAQNFSREERSLKANGHTVRYDRIVLATHTPLTGRASVASASLFQTKLALYTTYVVAGRSPKGQFRMRCSGTRTNLIIISGSSRLPTTTGDLRGRGSQDRPGGGYARVFRTPRKRASRLVPGIQ